VKLNLQPCHAHDILDEALALVRPDIAEKQLRLTLRLEAPTTPSRATRCA